MPKPSSDALAKSTLLTFCFSSSVGVLLLLAEPLCCIWIRLGKRSPFSSCCRGGAWSAFPTDSWRPELFAVSLRLWGVLQDQEVLYLGYADLKEQQFCKLLCVVTSLWMSPSEARTAGVLGYAHAWELTYPCLHSQLTKSPLSAGRWLFRINIVWFSCMSVLKHQLKEWRPGIHTWNQVNKHAFESLSLSFWNSP